MSSNPTTTNADDVPVRLLPCPFCGAHDVEFYSTYIDNVDDGFVRCDCCGASPYGTQAKAEAKARWNNRAQQSTGEMTDDVRELVIAARIFWDVHNDMSPESHDLDKALEAFASRVPYENEPDEDALAIKGGEANG